MKNRSFGGPFGGLFGEGFGGQKNVTKCSHHYVRNKKREPVLASEREARLR